MHATPSGSQLSFRCSPAVTFLAYACMAYAMACLGYLALTRGMGTPFLDSLSDEQRCLKRASTERRACAFALALGASVVALAAWTPVR